MAWKTYIIKQFIQHITKRPLTQSRGLFFMSQSSNTMSQTTSDAAIPHFWSQYYFWCPNLTILLLNLTLLLLLMPQSHNTTSESHTLIAILLLMPQSHFWSQYYIWCPNVTLLILHLMPQCHTFDQYYIWCPNVTLLILHLMPQSHTFDRGVLHGTGEGLLWANKACNANHVIITPWQRGGRSSRPLFSSHLPDTFSLPWSLSLWIKNWPPQT